MITNERVRYILTELKHRGLVNLPQCERDDNMPIRAQYTGDGMVRYSNKCEEIDLLHEIGHHIYGYDCCREHDEFAATGIAVCLATMLNIDQGNLLERMSEYAGRSICPRLDGAE